MTKKNSSTLQEQAYKYVKSKITSFKFKPGEYITDIKIANYLNSSRTPVREAFRKLEREGLLIYKPRHGWKIYILSLKDINEIFEIKITLEGLLSRKAAKCKNKILRRKLKESLQRMQEASVNNLIGTWVKIDVDLHNNIFKMAGNQRATNFIENINDQWNRLRIGFSTRIQRTEQSISEHKNIVEAILSNDADKAEQETKEHLRHVCNELVSLLKKMVLPYAKDGV